MRKQESDRGLPACVGLVLMLGLFAPPLRAQENAGTGDMERSGDQAPKVYGGGFDAAGNELLTAAETFGDGKTTALTQSLWRLDSAAARELIESGADINAKRRRGVTPLLFLVIHQKAEAVQLALSLGADPSLASDFGGTPLYYAMKADRWEELLKMLVNAGADIEKASKLTRFRYCEPIERRVLMRIRGITERGDVELLWWLLEHGGNVNSQSCGGGTLLDLAYAAREFDIAYGLLERGANPHIGAGSGQSSAEWMRMRPMGPYDEDEAPWGEKIHKKLDELRDNEEMIREAREIDAAFAKFHERYKKTEWGAANERRRKEIGAIVETLEERVDEAKKPGD